MIFVGYEEGTKGYRVYNPATQKVQVTRDVLFEESRPWTWNAQGAVTAPAPTTFTVVYANDHGVHELDTGCSPTPAPRSAAPPPSTPPLGSPLNSADTPAASAPGMSRTEPCTPAAAREMR